MMQAVIEFLHMGGYGSYVWSAFALSFVTLLLNLVVPLMNEKKILRGIARQGQRTGK